MLNRVRIARLPALVAALSASLLVAPATMRSAPGSADVVLEWNEIALVATATASPNPLLQIRSMAIVQVAVHDAVNAITREYETYLSTGNDPWSGSPEAAAIAAAHVALTHLFPAQATALDTARAASLAAHEISAGDPGIELGEAIAAEILAIRSDDGAATAQFPYTAPGAGTPGVWMPTGPAAPVLPGWGQVEPWVIRGVEQFRPGAPPELESGRYARDYNEVKEIGSLTSLTRTAEQTQIARFWVANPAPIWNPLANQVIDAWQLDVSESARAIALMYLAAADASIVCWDAKYLYNFWRPMTAIRNGDADGNDRTVADPAWTPLLTTPQHPEYISGHSTNSSAMGSTLALIFGDAPGITLVAATATTPGFERHWAAFSEGIDEVIEARIYGGIHYRTTDVVGARVGRKIARFVVNHALKPVRKHHPTR